MTRRPGRDLPGTAPENGLNANGGGGLRFMAFGAIIGTGVTLAIVSLAGLPDWVVKRQAGGDVVPLKSGAPADATTAKTTQIITATYLKPKDSAPPLVGGTQTAAVEVHVSPTKAKAAPPTGPQTAPANKPVPITKTVQVRKGDTLMKALTRAGAPRREAHEAIAALGKNFNPRRLKIGQQVRVALAPDAKSKNQADRLISIHIATDVNRQIAALRRDKGFVFDEIVEELDKGYMRAGGPIKDSLFLSARRAGVPIGVLMELIRIFSWDVDFQRDIQRGDKFEVLFERFHNASGKPVKNGEVLHAALTLSGTTINLYRHELSDGAIDYFNEKGQSARKALLRTPVNGARLSSRYGKRRHPILGYTKVHRGLDFAAPRGTPVMAGGDGVVEMAKRNGAYGKYVRIRHNSNYKTAYAHLNGYGRGIRRGKRVRQGQIIGYIGSTGRSTGPHLHYEILKGGRQINPLRLKLPTGRKLKGKSLTRFQADLAKIEAARAATSIITKVASSD